MNDSAQSRESREYKTSQPATAIASHRVLPEKVAEYRQAQTAITDAARRCPGFVGTEVLSPVPGLQDEWVAIFRLESNQAMKRWLESPERTKLVERIEHCLAEPSHLLILASDEHTEPPVAMVFTHRIRKERVEDYLAWRRRAIVAQAHIPGYLATEFFEPKAGGQEEWVDIVRYDSVEHLNVWLESKERTDLLKELDPIVESRHEHRVTGLEGWFALNRAPDEPVIPPPPWKQALTVLLALYPTVMTLNLITGPLMRNVSLPVNMLIGNVLSVALLTWIIMPWVTRWLNFWLSIPAQGRVWWREALGICTVAGFLALFVVVFRLV
jgi:antibiotic biosynthesis monooxygenase (ABM) superfamily enzyme